MRCCFCVSYLPHPLSRKKITYFYIHLSYICLYIFKTATYFAFKVFLFTLQWRSTSNILEWIHGTQSKSRTSYGTYASHFMFIRYLYSWERSTDIFGEFNTYLLLYVIRSQRKTYCYIIINIPLNILNFSN